MEQSDKYHKSRAVGVTPEVGLTTDRDLSVPTCFRNTIYLRDTGSHVVRATIQKIRKNKKRETVAGIELLIQESIWALRRKKNYRFWRILGADLSVPTCLRNTIYLRDTGSHVVLATIQQ